MASTPFSEKAEKKNHFILYQTSTFEINEALHLTPFYKSSGRNVGQKLFNKQYVPNFHTFLL